MREENSSQYNLQHPLARDWLSVRDGTQFAETTVRTYTSQVRQFLSFLQKEGLELLDIDVKIIINYIETLVRRGKAESTVKGHHSTICDLYRYIDVRTEENPVLNPYRLKEISMNSYSYESGFKRDALSREEIRKLLNNFKIDRNRIMAYVAVCTGLRNSDVRNCKLNDIDYDELELYVSDPKGGDAYHVPLPKPVARRLIQWQNVGRKSYAGHKTHNYVFPTNRGGKLKTNCQFSDAVRDAAEKAGIQKAIGSTKYYNSSLDKHIHRTYYKVTPHTLRHTYITLLKEADTPDEARRKAANHSSMETTKNYEHIDSEHDEHIRSVFDSGF
jgi:integrase/recombinase XerD